MALGRMQVLLTKSTQFLAPATVQCKAAASCSPTNLSCSNSHSSIIREVPQGCDSSYFSGHLIAGGVIKSKKLLLKNNIKMFSSETCM